MAYVIIYDYEITDSGLALLPSESTLTTGDYKNGEAVGAGRRTSSRSPLGERSC